MSVNKSVEDYVELFQQLPVGFSNMHLQTLRERFGEEVFPQWLDTIDIGEHPDIVTHPDSVNIRMISRSEINPQLWKITEMWCYLEYLNPITKPGLHSVAYLLYYFHKQFTEIMSYFRAMSIVLNYEKYGYYSGVQIAVVQ